MDLGSAASGPQPSQGAQRLPCKRLRLQALAGWGRSQVGVSGRKAQENRDTNENRAVERCGCGATECPAPQKRYVGKVTELAAPPPTGGRTWWAHVGFTRINIAPPILRKRMEDDLDLRAFRAVRKSE